MEVRLYMSVSDAMNSDGTFSIEAKEEWFSLLEDSYAEIYEEDIEDAISEVLGKDDATTEEIEKVLLDGSVRNLLDEELD